jgi:MFS family permease
MPPLAIERINHYNRGMSKSIENPADLSPTHVRFGVLGFACTLSLITYLDRVCIMRVSEAIRIDLDIDRVQMGLVFSAFLLGYALFEVPGGWMGDVWGTRRVITRIVLWWSAFTALTGFIWPFTIGGPGNPVLGLEVPVLFNSFLALLLVRFLFGCGEAGAYPNLARVVGGWFPFQERGLAQGAIWMSARLGGAIAPFVIGRLTVGFGGWRQAFWVLGAIGAVWCIFFVIYFRNKPEEHPACNAAERELIRGGPYSWKASEAGTAHGPVPWGVFFTSGSVLAMCVVSATVSFGWYFYPTWQPQYLKDSFGISFEDSELITGLPFLCGAAGCIIGGRFSDYLVRWTGSRRWGRSLMGVIGFSGAGVCVMSTGFVTEAWQAVTLLCLAFFINDIAIPPIWAVCADIGGKYSGTLSGVMNMSGGVGAIISPSLTPLLLRHFDWTTVFIVLASAWFIGAVAWLFIDAGKRLDV